MEGPEALAHLEVGHVVTDVVGGGRGSVFCSHVLASFLESFRRQSFGRRVRIIRTGTNQYVTSVAAKATSTAGQLAQPLRATMRNPPHRQRHLHQLTKHQPAKRTRGARWRARHGKQHVGIGDQPDQPTGHCRQGLHPASENEVQHSDQNRHSGLGQQDSYSDPLRSSVARINHL